MEIFNTYTTLIKTKDGKVYDLGKLEYRPIHKHQGNTMCDECHVINAWTERIN